MKYLVDSDWIIDALIGVPAAVNALIQLNPDGLAVSIIAVGEVYEGAHSFSDPQAELAKYRKYLAGFTTLGISEPVMVTFSTIRASLRRQGLLIPDLDLLIAATAITHDLTLLTRNTRHFQRIPDLKRYQS
jgi:tRNA(fMet)-specific endonuclease VapC